MQTYRSILLSSFVALLAFVFVVSEVSAQRAAIMAIDEPAEAGGGAVGGGSKAYEGTTGKSSGSKARSTSSKSTRSKTTATRAAPPAKPRPWNGFVVGDKFTFLNFEVVSAEKPYHTREAKANGAKGLVQVEVLIDTNGSVIQAKARTGNKLLHPEAERAAMASKFNRPTFGGKPARAIGFLVYRFGPADDDD